MLLSLPYLCDEWLVMLIDIGYWLMSRVNCQRWFFSELPPEKHGVLQPLHTVAASLKSGGGLAIGNDLYNKLIEPPING